VGQERFRSVTKSHYCKTAGVILVYDIAQRDTFDHIPRWLEDVRHATALYTFIYLVGNKSDLEADRQVTLEEAQKFAQLHDLILCEAETNKNVDRCLLETTSRIYALVTSETIDANALGSDVRQCTSAHSSCCSSMYNAEPSGMNATYNCCI
jgi:Ras-related protein Rab-14